MAEEPFEKVIAMHPHKFRYRSILWTLLISVGTIACNATDEISPSIARAAPDSSLFSLRDSADALAPRPGNGDTSAISLLMTVSDDFSVDSNTRITWDAVSLSDARFMEELEHALSERHDTLFRHMATLAVLYAQVHRLMNSIQADSIPSAIIALLIETVEDTSLALPNAHIPDISAAAIACIELMFPAISEDEFHSIGPNRPRIRRYIESWLEKHRSRLVWDRQLQHYALRS